MTSEAHDRTLRLAKTTGIRVERLHELQEVRVLLELGDDASEDPLSCLSFLTLCNIATRLGPWAPHIDIRVPNDAMTPPSRIYHEGSTLASEGLRILRESISTDGLHRGHATTKTYHLALTIGQATAHAQRRLYLGWDHWLATITAEERARVSDGNPLGAFLSAAMGTARLHQHHVLHLKGKIAAFPLDPWSLSAFALDAATIGPRVERGLTLPRALMVGGGALGSTTTYALSHVPHLSTAGVDTVDHDVITETSSNRQITAPYSRAVPEDFPKVRDLELAWPSIRPAQERYEDWKARTGKTAGDYPLAITAVDSIEVRRNVAGDLPRVLIDGATGGLGIAITRVDSPDRGCLRCEYPIVETDESGLWAARLGIDRASVEDFRTGRRQFDDTVLDLIGEHGTLVLDDEEEANLKNEGWAFLIRRGCGGARPDRELPHASVSYVSATCGFLIAAQAVKEAMGAQSTPLGNGRERWEWDNLFANPTTGTLRKTDIHQPCAETHAILSRVYHQKHGAISVTN